jgi:glycine cleavage system H lipoate-binding protein
VKKSFIPNATNNYVELIQQFRKIAFFSIQRLSKGAAMAIIERFLGQTVCIPDELQYDVKQGLWVKKEGADAILGLTEPALVLNGGIHDLDWLVTEGAEVTEHQDVAFAITGKILYLSTPFAGRISFNPDAKERPVDIKEDPYGRGWVFRVTIEADLGQVFSRLADAGAYIERLKESDGCKNPEGLKGGVSGICKAVYSGIRTQKVAT